MKYNNVLFPVLLFCSFSFHTQGQQVIKGFETQEIYNISQTYRYTSSLSFTLQINYADSARQDSVLEQIPASYKMQNGMYWAMIDSTEMVQGQKYNVTVFHYDSVIAISNSLPNTNVMQLPLIDSLFRAQNIHSMDVKDLNDSTRALHMYFTPESQYTGFIINYNSDSYLINSITYYIKSSVDEDNEVSGTGMIKVIYSNYTFGPIDDSYFRESKFIYKQDGKFFATTPYSDFQLMINTDN